MSFTNDLEKLEKHAKKISKKLNKPSKKKVATTFPRKRKQSSKAGKALY